MMGMPIQNPRVPVVKGTNGILALTAAETPEAKTMPCIRCGRCVQGCPVGLTPFELNALIHAGDLEGAARVGLMDCLACGCCAYNCPANLPLVQSFQFAKGKLSERQSRKHQQEETKRLAAARKAREEAILEAKKQMMLKRKAEMAAKKKAEEEAAAALAMPLPATGSVQGEATP